MNMDKEDWLYIALAGPLLALLWLSAWVGDRAGEGAGILVLLVLMLPMVVALFFWTPVACGIAIVALFPWSVYNVVRTIWSKLK